MECAENKVAGVSRENGEFDGLEIAHFADQHNIRIFTQGPFEASGETESEVKQKMSEHAHESHAADIAGKTDEEFEKVMSDSVREA